jgi:hypothetical protein
MELGTRRRPRGHQPVPTLSGRNRIEQEVVTKRNVHVLYGNKDENIACKVASYSWGNFGVKRYTSTPFPRYSINTRVERFGRYFSNLYVLDPIMPSPTLFRTVEAPNFVP